MIKAHGNRCRSSWRSLRRTTVKESGRHSLRLGNNISALRLRCQLPLRLVTVSLALAILLESVLHRDLFAEEVLPMQVVNRGVTRLEVPKADKAKALTRPGIIPRHLWHAQQRAEPAECIVQNLLIDHRIQISNEELCANLCTLLLVRAGFIHTQRFAVQFDSVHDIGGVLSVGRGTILYEAEALVGLGDAVAGHVNVVNWAHLEHDLVDDSGGGALVDVADVHSGILVLLPGELYQMLAGGPARRGEVDSWDHVPVPVLRHLDGQVGGIPGDCRK